MTRRVAAIVGPTAVGKSEVAVEVSLALGAEIVSIDSMQAYRDLDAGTAKPSAELRESVPHHLVDVYDPSVEVTVAEFQRAARAAVEAIGARGRLPLLVGGSGLYFRAVVDELDFPPRAEEVRRALEEEAERVGPEALHGRLAEVDPAAAARIDVRNARRTIRALEVIELTGRPFSDNDRWERYESVYDLTVAGLRRERGDLDARIEERVDSMLHGGLIEEAWDLAPRLGRTARQALGYRQILERPPGTPAEEVREPIIQATRRFARRQESWFRSDPRVEWFDAAAGDLVPRLSAHLSAASG